MSANSGGSVVVKDGREYMVVSVEREDGEGFEEVLFLVSETAATRPSTAGPAPSPTDAKIDAIIAILGSEYPRHQVRRAVLTLNEGEDLDYAIEALLDAGPISQPQPRSGGARTMQTSRGGTSSRGGSSSAASVPRAPRPVPRPTAAKPPRAPRRLPRELAGIMEGSSVHPRNEVDAFFLEDLNGNPVEREEAMGDAEGTEEAPAQPKPAARKKQTLLEPPEESDSESVESSGKSPKRKLGKVDGGDFKPASKATKTSGDKSAGAEVRRSARARVKAEPDVERPPSRGPADEDTEDLFGVPVELAQIKQHERIHLGDIRAEMDKVPESIAKLLKSNSVEAYGGLKIILDGSGVARLDLVSHSDSGPCDFEPDGTGLHPYTFLVGKATGKSRFYHDSAPFKRILEDAGTEHVASLSLIQTPGSRMDDIISAWKLGLVELGASVARTAVVEKLDTERVKRRSKGKGKQKDDGSGEIPLPPRLATPNIPDLEDEDVDSLSYTISIAVFLTEKALRYGTTPQTARDAFVEKGTTGNKRASGVIRAFLAVNKENERDFELFDFDNKWNLKGITELGKTYLVPRISIAPETDSYYRTSPTYYNPLGDASVYTRKQTQDLELDLEGLLDYCRPPDDAPEAPSPPGIKATLLPFQKKALHWMIRKETDLHQEPEGTLHPLWLGVKLEGFGGDKRTMYLHEISGTPSMKRFVPPKTEPGGCLAEEMGLGKTVEVLALILAHPRDFTAPDPSRSKVLMDRIEHEYARPLEVKATLIVAPQAITPQWIDETMKHTPGLKFTVFETDYAWWHSRQFGILGSERKSVAELFGDCDIVFTTYETLTSELRRSGKSKKSALLWVQWWRIVLDEAQMVADSNATAARMAGELWRTNGWTVSGTPVSNALNDIHGLLAFLDSDPFASKEVIRDAVMEPFLKRLPSGIQRMRGLLPKFLWRHAKKHVKHEFELPDCTEERIELDFVQAEKLFYKKLSSDTREYLKAQFSLNSGTLSMTSLVIGKMTALRQCCDHPQLTGSYNATSNKNWAQLKNKTLTYEDIMGEILRKAESELEGLEYDYVNEILLTGYATLQQELKEPEEFSDSDSENENEPEPPPKYNRKQLLEFYISCLQIINRNLELVSKLDRTVRLMVEYFGSAKLALRKWLRVKWHAIAQIRVLDDKHPILEAIGADEQADYLKELLEDTDFSQDEIEKRYWLNTYKAVAVMRNETEGLRRKRVNEITRVQRRPLKVIENSLDTISGKMRSKMGEVNHVKSRVEQEIARRQRVAAAAKPDPGSNAAGPADPDAMDVDEPLDRPGPSAPAPPNNDSIMCSICFEEIEEPTVTPCAHEFCLDCIKGVIEASPHCPLCRTKLSFKDLRVAAPKKDEEEEEMAEALGIKGEYGSKITRIITDIQSRLARDPTFKAVVFSHWKPMLKLLGKAFAFNNISAVDFSGDKETRAEALRKIKDDPKTTVILVSMRAKDGAAGLTLTCCNTCFIVDPSPYPGITDQAIGRINRIGQTRPTTVVHLIVKDTIENKIESIQANKRVTTRRGAEGLVDAAKAIAKGKGKLSAAKMRVEGAAGDREELQTDEVCFIFDLDLEELRRESERQRDVVERVREHQARMGRGGNTVDEDEEDGDGEHVENEEEQDEDDDEDLDQD